MPNARQGNRRGSEVRRDLTRQSTARPHLAWYFSAKKLIAASTDALIGRAVAIFMVARTFAPRAGPCKTFKVLCTDHR